MCNLMNTKSKVCNKCGEEKPLTDFALSNKRTDGRSSDCKTCRAAQMRERRQQVAPDVHNTRQAAFRAGMRKDKCAVCSGAISGEGICDACLGHIRALGGTEADLKRAAKAVKYLASL